MERARQICLRAERMAHRHEIGYFIDLNEIEDRYGTSGVRLFNCLKRGGFETKEEVIESIESGKILKVRNLGVSTARLLCDYFEIPMPEYLAERPQCMTTRMISVLVNKNYESCDGCIHCEDNKELCVLRECVHAINLKECYEPKSGKE